MTENEWDDLLRKANFTGLNAVLWDTPDTENHHSSTMISTATSKTVPTLSEVTIITESPSPEPCVDHLRGLLRDVGVRSKVASITGCDPANQVCIVLSELAHSVLRNPSPAQFRAIKRIFLEGAGALWVTRGALIESSAPDFNLVTGIARTVRAEKGDTMLVTLDLDPRTPLFRTSVAETIFTVFKTNFSMESMGFADLDTEYAERNGLIMIPRVVEDRALTSFVLSNTGSPIPEDQPYYQKGRPLRAEIKTPGFLDSLQFVDDVRISGILLDDFVQIDVKASGINFRDVMSASGQIDPYPLGCECAGVVVAAGKSVQDFCPGDHVIANVPGGSICNTIRASTREVEHIPQDMPFEIAASLPIIYFTAYYAVIKVARLCKDETILVHAASGGLGQAIINLSQVIGAEIFATVGTLEKKSLLITQFKIPEDHIFSSRDDTFAKGVMRRTGGKGVNVIMNSVSGDALRLTWNCIAPFGRFVELGKRDLTINSRLEMRHFEKNVTFTGLDVPLHTGHEEKRRIWCEIMSLYRKGQIKAPHPITLFGVSETEKALRIMQTGKHKGKLVLMPRPEEIVKVVPRDNSHRLLRADASYLLIGGLGGIGRALAIWMIKHGARNFIFASPSGLEKKKARDCVALLKARGAKAAVFKCDVSSITDLDRVLDESKKIMPPIRGMIHAAMVPKVSERFLSYVSQY
jgi:NADPH:quinone reductase-like Zn-dependent oxidoreductase